MRISFHAIEARALRRRIAREWAHARRVLRIAQRAGQYGIAATFREVARNLEAERRDLVAPGPSHRLEV